MEKEVEKNHYNYSVWILPLVWVLFFTIIGIVLQSLEAKSLIFLDFFSKNYIAWFNLFGNFVSQIQSASWQDFFSNLIYYWYYFFFTGGILSLLWLTLTSFFSLIFRKRDSNKSNINIEKLPELEKSIEPIYSPKDKKDSLNEWLDEGLRMLAEKNTEEAEMIYENIRRAYNPQEDLNQEFYVRIKEFYEVLNKSKNNK